MRRLLREPLVHFLLGGAALFVLHGLVAEPEAEARGRIRVDAARIEMLRESFQRTWQRAPTAEALGAPTLLPAALAGATPAEIAGYFGADFAEALVNAPEARWSGPLVSPFGLHLVRVSARVPGRLPPFEDARRLVEREWTAEQRELTRARFYRELRGRYDIEVSPSSDAAQRDGAGPS